jgi:hypothetical protein
VASEKDAELLREADLWMRVFNQASEGETKGGGGSSASDEAAKAAHRKAVNKLNGEKREGKGGSKRRARKFRKSAFSVLSLMARFIYPLFLLFILFSVIFGSFYVTVGKVLTLTAATVAAGQRSACAVQSLVALQKFAYAYVDPNSRSILFYYGVAALDCVKNNNALLSFDQATSGLSNNYASYSGAPENGLPSAVLPSETTTLYNLAFGDLCTELAEHDHDFDVPRCRAFGGGVATLGLSALINKYYNTLYGLFDLGFRTSFVVGSMANASGWTQSADVFPYDSRPCTLAIKCNPADTLLFQKTPIPPSYLPDSTWEGDILPGVVPAYSKPYTPATIMASPEFMFVEEALKMYIQPCVEYMHHIYIDAANRQLESFLELIRVFIPAAVAVIVVVILLRWLPSTGRENKRIMNKRSMLLYLPIAVVFNMPTLKAMVQDIIAREGDEAMAKKSGGSSKVAPQS